MTLRRQLSNSDNKDLLIDTLIPGLELYEGVTARFHTSDTIALDWFGESYEIPFSHLSIKSPEELTKPIQSWALQNCQVNVEEMHKWFAYHAWHPYHGRMCVVSRRPEVKYHRCYFGSDPVDITDFVTPNEFEVNVQGTLVEIHNLHYAPFSFFALNPDEQQLLVGKYLDVHDAQTGFLVRHGMDSVVVAGNMKTILRFSRSLPQDYTILTLDDIVNIAS